MRQTRRSRCGRKIQKRRRRHILSNLNLRAKCADSKDRHSRRFVFHFDSVPSIDAFSAVRLRCRPIPHSAVRPEMAAVYTSRSSCVAGEPVIRCRDPKLSVVHNRPLNAKERVRNVQDVVSCTSNDVCVEDRTQSFKKYSFDRVGAPVTL